MAAACAKSALEMTQTTFFNKEDAPDKAIEVMFGELDSEPKVRRYLRNPESFIVTSLRKERVEVNERKLNDEDKELIRHAKGQEVRLPNTNGPNFELYSEVCNDYRRNPDRIAV